LRIGQRREGSIDEGVLLLGSGDGRAHCEREQ
jgi:hypothetical protein